MRDATGTWLCPTEHDRARMLESSRRLRRTRLLVAIGIGVASLASAPWMGWWPLFFSAVAVAQLATLHWRTQKTAKPEYYVAFSFLFTAACIAAAAALTGGPESPVLPLLGLPVMLVASRFRLRVVLVGLALSLVLLLACTLGTAPAETLENPDHVIVTAVLLIGLVVFTLSLSKAELELRVQSRFDHLTGLLNRAALRPRFDELRDQAHATGASVALVIYDLDHFKAINDKHGHDVGDVVLRDSAAQLRRHLRPFDLAYRLGGEEFAVVLPGVTAQEARLIAERQRRAVELARPGGLHVTISGGVAAASGTEVEWDALYRRADSALLRAKREGRNRVLVDPESVGPNVPPPRRAVRVG